MAEEKYPVRKSPRQASGSVQNRSVGQHAAQKRFEYHSEPIPDIPRLSGQEKREA